MWLTVTGKCDTSTTSNCGSVSVYRKTNLTVGGLGTCGKVQQYPTPVLRDSAVMTDSDTAETKTGPSRGRRGFVTSQKESYQSVVDRIKAQADALAAAVASVQFVGTCPDATALQQLKSCEVVAYGSLCKGTGICGTTTNLNNCPGKHDVYKKTQLSASGVGQCGRLTAGPTPYLGDCTPPLAYIVSDFLPTFVDTRFTSQLCSSTAVKQSERRSN